MENYIWLPWSAYSAAPLPKEMLTTPSTCPLLRKALRQTWLAAAAHPVGSIREKPTTDYASNHQHISNITEVRMDFICLQAEVSMEELLRT